MENLAQQPSAAARIRDRIENFHGKQLLYVGWDRHTMICAPIALLVEPDISFGEVVDRLLPDSAFALHPDWPRIDWTRVEWQSSDRPFTPDPARGLREQGLGHKAYLRLRTPGLDGIAGTGS